jgi:hypothetical protein
MNHSTRTSVPLALTGALHGKRERELDLAVRLQRKCRQRRSLEDCAVLVAMPPRLPTQAQAQAPDLDRLLGSHANDPYEGVADPKGTARRDDDRYPVSHGRHAIVSKAR